MAKSGLENWVLAER